MKKLTQIELNSLLTANAVQSVIITADSGGFYLTFDINSQPRILCAQRGHIRYFVYVDTALSFLHKHGISKATIIFTNLSSTQRLFS